MLNVLNNKKKFIQRRYCFISEEPGITNFEQKIFFIARYFQYLSYDIAIQYGNTHVIPVNI